jgi:hypothetical protein
MRNNNMFKTFILETFRIHIIIFLKLLIVANISKLQHTLILNKSKHVI